MNSKNESTKEFLFSLWLVPSKPGYDFINGQILKLAQQYSAPTYEPHMTLFCGATDDIERTKKEFREIFSQVRALTLQPEKIEHTSFFYKTLFIKFIATNEIKSLNESVHQQLDSSSDYKLYPHASMLYKANVSDQQKEELAKEIWPALKKISESMTFDEVWLTTDTDDVSEAAVKSWKVLDTVKLK